MTPAPAGGTHVSTGTVTVDYAVRSPRANRLKASTCSLTELYHGLHFRIYEVRGRYFR